MASHGTTPRLKGKNFCQKHWIFQEVHVVNQALLWWKDSTDWFDHCLRSAPRSLPSAKQPLPNKKIQLQTGIYISFETSLQEGRAKVWTSSTTLQTCPIDLERSVDFGSSIPQVASHGTAIFNHPASCLHIAHTPGCLGQHMTQLLPETENS
jgi:hypothetical protein